LNDQKVEAIYEEFRCELGIHERDMVNAQNLHQDLLNKNPFRYESPYLLSAVCVYAISHDIPQDVTLTDIEKISHIKKEDILKCYKLVLDSELSSFLQQRDDDISQ
jgi:transcription initiation factor TFIIIB Brf1 subunit/transcription initiation factor TFIIB